ncbi:MAG: 4-alpha-glucanotransferase [Desulfobacterales bacterium]|nr:MAG: 4-alpha-glucanotransferase [Desulfobacterales bacterium]
MNVRSSGILLHPTCLPTAYGIGDLGPAAYRFVDFLAAAGQSLWQILPLTPTDPKHNNSPYHSTSALAGNPLLISPELLVKEGLLAESDLADARNPPGNRIDFEAVGAIKYRLFDIAHDRFQQKTGDKTSFERFCARQDFWLDEYALFAALKDRFDGRPWIEWPLEIRQRSRDDLSAMRQELASALQREKFLQYVFFRQWMQLKDYCRRKEIKIVGDIPIYVHYDSVDVWCHPALFKLDENLKPYVVSGVPPDYFSQTGQLWGHPLYRWEALQDSGYHWWILRLQHNLQLCDIVRIDHFRGLVAYWEVPAQEKTAVNGKWVSAPVDDFFHHLLRKFACLPIIAEDLGTISADVRETMQRYQLPGMRLLLFAFGEDFPDGAFLPHNHVKNCLVYTGTHDNNTARGWFETEATPETKVNLMDYLGGNVPADRLHWELIRLAMMSVADTAIIPMQDLLGLGAEARMNNPSKLEGNWHWRLAENPVTTELTDRLRGMTRIYGRA